MLDLTALASIIKNTGAYGALSVFGYYIGQAMATKVIMPETGILGFACCMILIVAVYMASDRQRGTVEAIQSMRAAAEQQAKTNTEVVGALHAITTALNLRNEQQAMLDQLAWLAGRLADIAGVTATTDEDEKRKESKSA